MPTDPVREHEPSPGGNPPREQAVTWGELRPRIEEAARRAHDHKTAYTAELERRNQLITEALDHNLAPSREVARAAKITVAQLFRVLD